MVPPDNELSGGTVPPNNEFCSSQIQTKHKNVNYLNCMVFAETNFQSRRVAITTMGKNSSYPTWKFLES